jgi:hypothetical protein
MSTRSSRSEMLRSARPWLWPLCGARHRSRVAAKRDPHYVESRDGTSTTDTSRSIVKVMTGGTASTPPELGRVRADLVVLTVLREEFEAVLECLGWPVLLLGGAGTPNTNAWRLGTIASARYRAAFWVAPTRSSSPPLATLYTSFGPRAVQ